MLVLVFIAVIAVIGLVLIFGCRLGSLRNNSKELLILNCSLDCFYCLPSLLVVLFLLDGLCFGIGFLIICCFYD